MTFFLSKRLQRRCIQGNLRVLEVRSTGVDFSSNDYLGLARSPLLLQYTPPIAVNGFGSTGSRLLTGNSQDAQDLEEEIARFHGQAAGLLFNCGYMANVGLLPAVTDSRSVIFYDAAVHASMRDGIRLSQAAAFPFRHNDPNHLEHRLKMCSAEGDRFICVESIYSTDGSLAPLAEFHDLARLYDAYLIVDEAHAVGVWGPSGRGLLADQAKPMDRVFAQVVTFGKALGTHGAIILGSQLLKQALINFATSCLYTTALPFQLLAAIRASYRTFPGMDLERKQIRELVNFWRSEYSMGSNSQIQSVIIRGNQEVKAVSNALSACGYDVRALMSPTVRQGGERIRICLHAFNTVEQLADLIQALKQVKHA